MKKLYLFVLLAVATTVMAEVRVETFDVKDGTTTKTYVTAPTTKECQKASWTVFAGGVLKNLGNMGDTNYAAVTRAMKDADNGVYPYMESSTIEDGIDSLWLDWNSNGDESGNWNIVIYINGDSITSITDKAGAKIAAGQTMNKFGIGQLNIDGDFTIKIVNKSLHGSTDQSKNFKRFVIDNLSWTTHGSAPIKPNPEFKFADEMVYKKVNVIAFSNPLTNGSDGTPVYKSSNKDVATVAENGTVTIVGEGLTTITATVAETETYKAAEASYTLRVVPINFNIETFDGAANITSGTSYYLTAVTPCPASTATGIVWTTWLGSVRNAVASWPAANNAAAIRGKKSTETEYGYLVSDAISGGIDSLAFDWNSNANESSAKSPWNIEIYINDQLVGSITDQCANKKPSGEEFRYTLGNLKVDGAFTIKFVNKNDNDEDVTGNQYRWVMDNLEWYSYKAPCDNQYGIMVDGETYIAGVKDDSKEHAEYKIEANLNADQTFVIYNYCAEESFMANQEEGGYWFHYTNDNHDAFKAPATGKYTIYLKMYGPGNNWIWTSYETATGMSGTAIKADVRKVVENGTVVIYRNGVRYNLQGKEL